MIKKLIYLSILAVIFSPLEAFAVSKKVSSPNVTKGEWAIENKGTVEFDDDNEDVWKNAIEVEYSLTDRVKISVGGEIEKEENHSLEYEASEIEATVKMTGDEF